jgi:hypothetical protein
MKTAKEEMGILAKASWAIEPTEWVWACEEDIRRIQREAFVAGSMFAWRVLAALTRRGIRWPVEPHDWMAFDRLQKIIGTHEEDMRELTDDELRALLGESDDPE